MRYKQGVALTGRNTTGPPRSSPWWVTSHRGVLQTLTDDRQRRQMHGVQNNTLWLPTLRLASNNPRNPVYFSRWQMNVCKVDQIVISADQECC